MSRIVSMRFKKDAKSQQFANSILGILRDNTVSKSGEWMPISPGDKSFEYSCPTCDADIHEFCTSRDQDGMKREHHTEVHWSRCEVADGK